MAIMTSEFDLSPVLKTSLHILIAATFPAIDCHDRLRKGHKRMHLPLKVEDSEGECYDSGICHNLRMVHSARCLAYCLLADSQSTI